MLNEILSLVTVFQTIRVIMIGDGPRMKRWLCCWCILTIAMLIEDLLARGVPSKLMLMVMFMASDGLASELVLDTVILPRWAKFDEKFIEWTRWIAGSIQAFAVHWLAVLFTLYNKHIRTRSIIPITSNKENIQIEERKHN